MKQLLIRMFAGLGLVPAGQIETIRREAEQLKSASRTWKAESGKSAERIDALTLEVKRQTALAERLQRENTDLEQLRDRIAVAERELTAAREQLMAVEVKLDILEGAANVLDSRTRMVIRPARTQTSASA